MELGLGVFLAVAVMLAAWSFTSLLRIKDQEKRHLDELASLRKAVSVRDVQPAPGTGAEVAAALTAPVLAQPEPVAPAQPFEPLDTRLGSDGADLALRRLEPGANDIVNQLSALELLFSERLEGMSSIPGQLRAVAQDVPPFPELCAAPAAGPLERSAAASESTRDELSNTERLADGAADSSARTVEAGRNLMAAAIEGERVLQAMLPFSASFSGLSDRMNLLALNIALLASKVPQEGELFEPFGKELRGLFEEARRLSRDLATVSQKALNAAARTSEAAREVGQEASSTFARLRTTKDQLGRAQACLDQLDSALELVRSSTGHLAADAQKALSQTERVAAILKCQNAGISKMAGEIEQAMERLRPVSDSFFRMRTNAESHLMRLRSESNTP